MRTQFAAGTEITRLFLQYQDALSVCLSNGTRLIYQGVVKKMRSLQLGNGNALSRLIPPFFSYILVSCLVAQAHDYLSHLKLIPICKHGEFRRAQKLRALRLASQKTCQDLMTRL